MLRYTLIWRLFIGIIYSTLCSSEPVLHCNFDAAQKNSTELPCTCDGSPCSLIQSQGDQLDWITWQGSTPSVSTGPSDDHTLQNGNGLYIYVEISGENINDTATISTNQFNLEEESCLSFWYHMYGVHIGILQVNIVLDDNSVLNVWKKNGEQGNRWMEARIILQPNVAKVMFTSTKTIKWAYGDIALDDIRIDKVCPGTTTSQTTTLTPSPTTPSAPTPSHTPKPSESSAPSPATSPVDSPPDTTISSDGETLDKQDNNGLSSTVIIGIIVVVVVLVVAGTVITVVFLVLRHRRHIANSMKNETNQGSQIDRNHQNLEYEIVDETSMSTSLPSLQQQPQYEHIDEKHNDYANQGISGPYEVIK